MYRQYRRHRLCTVPQVQDSLFHRNGATQRGSGGAISAGGVMRLIVRNTTFRGCMSSGEAGAISAIGVMAGVVIASSNFTSCSAAVTGGAVNLVDTILASVYDTTFLNCSAVDAGGAMRMSGSSTWVAAFTTVRNSTFTKNYAGSNGGAVAVDENAQLVIVRSVFYANVAALGPAISSAQTCSYSDVATQRFKGRSDRLPGLESAYLTSLLLPVQALVTTSAVGIVRSNVLYAGSGLAGGIGVSTGPAPVMGKQPRSPEYRSNVSLQVGQMSLPLDDCSRHERLRCGEHVSVSHGVFVSVACRHMRYSECRTTLCLVHACMLRVDHRSAAGQRALARRAGRPLQRRAHQLQQPAAVRRHGARMPHSPAWMPHHHPAACASAPFHASIACMRVHRIDVAACAACAWPACRRWSQGPARCACPRRPRACCLAARPTFNLGPWPILAPPRPQPLRSLLAP